MSFLQPWMLAALPLMAMPILIHLIHRRRHQSVRWGAMMFIVRAKYMNRGMARVRYVLVMLLRMLAIAALVFAVSRPFASGRLGGLGLGTPDATLILLDRSASMEMQDLQTGASRRTTALGKLAELLERRGYGNQLVLIDSATEDAQAVEAPGVLLDLPSAAATATSADIPAMLDRAAAYLDANQAGRADLWVCSDLRRNDWDPGSGRWADLRTRFLERKGVRFFLLSYAGQASGNLAVRVDHVERRQRGKRAELVLDVRVLAEGFEPGSIPPRVPVEFEINGVASAIEMELESQGALLQGHRIPVDDALLAGWGSVSLPGDANRLDNRFYFTFAEPPVREAVVVTDDARVGEAFRRALSIPSDPGVRHQAGVLPAGRVAEIDWEGTALLIWNAPLPGGLVGDQIEQFVDAGGVAMFFPPDRGGDARLFGSRWSAGQRLESEPRLLSWWRGDAGLLAHVGSGDPLPLDELRVYRTYAIESEGTPLATLGNDEPLLVRVPTDRGGVYFCSTLPTASSSSFERDAIAFYVMLQRALEQGSRARSPAIQRDAGEDTLAELDGYELIAPTEDAPTVSQHGLRAGVYGQDDDLVAVNRGRAEDVAPAVPADAVDELFAGLSYERIDDAVGDTTSLASEIWRAFLMTMVLALVLEAVLCLPPKQLNRQGPTDERPPRRAAA